MQTCVDPGPLVVSVVCTPSPLLLLYLVLRSVVLQEAKKIK